MIRPVPAFVSKPVLVVLAFAALWLGAAPAGADPLKLRLGVQKYGTFIVLQTRGTLEQRLAPLGVTIEWHEFPGGPQLLEALNAGSIDVGQTGDAPPIFAQAANPGLVYVGVEPPVPAGEAILVPKDSPLKAVSELAGRRVALNKGSNVHYFLVQALAKAGVAYTDIKPVFLAPADARAAFEAGSVDAWAIWDPFYAAAQNATGARTLTDGTGLVGNRQFFLSTRDFAQGHADILSAITAEIAATDAWAKTHQDEVATLLGPRTGIDVPSLKVALARLGYGYGPLTKEVVADQQRIADTFFDLHLIPKKIDVADAVFDLKSAER